MTPLLMLLLLSCRADGPAEDGAAPPRAILALDPAWDVRPWASPDAGGSEHLRLAATVELPDDLAGRRDRSGTLWLEGAWWHVQLTVNGAALPPATGGLVPLEIPLGQSLRVGKNTLLLDIRAPGPQDLPIETGGSLSSRERSPGRALLGAPPILHLHPSTHVDDLALLSAEGGRLGARARVAEAPPGATVRFQAVLDGEVLATLGEVPVQDGQAYLSPVRAGIRGRWSPNDGQLFWLHAVLHDQTGQVLDEEAVRTGARTVTAQGDRLQLDGAALVLMGARMVQDPQRSFAERLPAFAAGGINALEIHGEWVREAWLSAADELGLPVVVVPRCIGRAGRGQGGPSTSALHRDQDARLRSALAGHPSVVLLATEGPSPAGVLWSDVLLEGSPEAGDRLPVAGDPGQPRLDLPAQFLQVSPEGHTCHPGDSCGATWVTEVTLRREQGQDPRQVLWQQIAGAFSAALALGGPGGIIPTPNGPRDQAGWAPAWRAVAERHGIPPAEGSGRGPSVLRVQGAQPGEPIWLSMPYLPRTGAIANARGEAMLTVYHDGAAEVWTRAGRQEVALTPGQWRGFAWQPQPQVVVVGGGGQAP